MSQNAVVTIDYLDLVQGIDVSDQIASAFGLEGLGLLTVSNVPQLKEFRSALLPLAQKFATQSEEIKSKYIHEESCYSFGWSHGKEKLQGKPDISKGSFYANPQYDRPVEDEEIIRLHSPFVHPNIWPKDEMPELEHAFKDLGQLIVHVGKLVAKQCDKYVKAVDGDYEENKLFSIIEQSKCCKARLLHYFPILSAPTEYSTQDKREQEQEEGFSSWCGWHNDHGSLTGLTSAMYLDSQGLPVTNTDKLAGLYIRNRSSELVKIEIPADHVAFQIGETAQIHSGGVLQATPHAVRGSSMEGVSRETFAVFMEPMWSEPMDYPSCRTLQQVQSQSAAANLPPGVPQLQSRWNPSQTFGEFTAATLSAYY